MTERHAVYEGSFETTTFWVDGEPRPKQSYRALKSGGGYQPARVKAWQDTVAWKAHEVMAASESQPLTGNVSMVLSFVLGNNRRVDLDNLSKGTLDALRGIVFVDDCQIVKMTVEKRVGDEPGVWISIISVNP